MAKKSKLLKKAERIEDYTPMYKSARGFIHAHLALPMIGEMKPDQVLLRSHVTKERPAQFLAELDGTKFCFAVSVRDIKKTEIKRVIDWVDISKLPDATEARARTQLKNFGLI